MRWTEIDGLTCSIARALSVVGDRWTLMVLRECFHGTRRFEDFEAYLRVSPHILSARLAKLVDAGVLARVPYSVRPPRDEYRLTEKGRDFYPVIAALVRWGDRWMDGGEGPPADLVHRRCGRATVPTMVCSECGEPLEAREMRVAMGPVLAAERAALAARR